ncbi:SWIM zinc finger family protein [Clostridium ljungdahlii]|uniref:SWIM zinc finger family protein n=1 Tax=Clostridium ljungdahlii TaxID=1538 RepID=UPI00386D7051
MDSKDNFLKELGKFIYSMDADYLAGISNKGITKRADKDLSKVSNIEYEVKNNSIEFKFDDITCSINENIKGYKCSCPSRSICKHVIMCYLYLMKNKEKLFDIQGCGSQSEEEEKFLALKEISIDTIKKKTGDKNLNDIIKRIEFGVNFEIKEGSIIEVNFIDENTLVKFLGNIENSTCTCKSKELCVHKAEALIYTN